MGKTVLKKTSQHLNQPPVSSFPSPWIISGLRKEHYLFSALETVWLLSSLSFGFLSCPSHPRTLAPEPLQTCEPRLGLRICGESHHPPGTSWRLPHAPGQPPGQGDSKACAKGWLGSHGTHRAPKTIFLGVWESSLSNFLRHSHLRKGCQTICQCWGTAPFFRLLF